MERWDSKYPNIGYYEKARSRGDVKLSKNLSPVTNFFCNVFYNTINSKNLVFAIPNNILRPIPILSYIFAKENDKSVLVLTQKKAKTKENPVDFHKKAYYLLNCVGGKYCFTTIPIGTIKRNEVNAGVWIPRAKRRRKYKEKFKKTQKKNFLNKECPRILLYYDENDTRISNFIEKIEFDQEVVDDINVKIEIGLIIFENVDRFIYSKTTFEKFLEWIDPLLEKDIRLIFHFSNPFSEYIRELHEYEKLDSLVLPFGPILLRNNKELRSNSKEYFEKKEEKKLERINKFNIDDYDFYKNLTDIEIDNPPLKKGNIDESYYRAKNYLDNIDVQNLKHKKQYYSMYKLLYKIHNLIVHPSKYKQEFLDPKFDWRHYRIPKILNVMGEISEKEEGNNEYYLSEFISEFYNLYYELKETKRFDENKSFSREIKSYRLLNKINNMPKEKREKSIVVAYSSMEANILENELTDKQLNDKLEVKFIGDLCRSGFNRKEKNLFLPGPPRLKYASEIFQPYNKINIIVYEGLNKRKAEDLIKAHTIYTKKRQVKTIEYLEEIYDFLGMKKDGLFTGFEKTDAARKYEMENKEKDKEKIKEDSKKESLENTIKDLMEIQLENKEYIKEDDEVEDIERKYRDSEENISDSKEYYKVVLRPLEKEYTIEKNLPIDHTYLYMKDIERKDVEETTPKNIGSGGYLILLKGDERQTLLDSIVDMFGWKDRVNLRLIKNWKERLITYIENNDIPYTELHREFEKMGGEKSYETVKRWGKGQVIAPRRKKDLEILGKVIGDEELIDNSDLIENEAELLRNIKRRTGKKIKKLVKRVLEGSFDKSELSLEEKRIFDLINQNIYEVIEKNRIKNNNQED